MRNVTLCVLVFGCLPGSANASAATFSGWPSSDSPSSLVTVSWSGVSWTSTDWVGLHTPRSSTRTLDDLQWFYGARCLQTHGRGRRRTTVHRSRPQLRRRGGRLRRRRPPRASKTRLHPRRCKSRCARRSRGAGSRLHPCSRSRWNKPPSIRLNGRTISWLSQPGVADFHGAISNLPRGQRSRTTSHVDLGNVASWTPSSPACGTTRYYGVASEGANGEQWSSSEASISGPACSGSPGIAVVSPGFVVGIQGKDEGQNTFAGLGGETVPQDIANLVPYVRWDNDADTASDLQSEYGSLGIKADLLLGTGTYNTSSSTGDAGADWGGGGIGGWASQQVTNIRNACGSPNPSAECPFVEILNEPYGFWFYGSDADSERSADAYALALEEVYTDIHNAFGNNSPKVLAWGVGPGCSNGKSTSCTDEWFTYLRNDNPELGHYYDGVLVHPYGGASGYSQTLSAQGNRNAVMSAYNATGKPVYVTEVGWPTDTGGSDTEDSQQWTETQQADNIYNFIHWARGTGYVAGVWGYAYTDGDAPSWYGVTRSNEPGQTAWSRKPGWTALQEAAHNRSCTVC